MGGIDLDPASAPAANDVVQASKYFTRDDDGLTQPWAGSVWLNPPYGRAKRTGAGAWAQRLIADYQNDVVREGLLLVNAMVGSVWFEQLYDYPMCFCWRRIRFLLPDKTPQDRPTYGNVIVYVGPQKQWRRFGRAFAEMGAVFAPAA